MKRFFALVALVLGLASCQTEPEGLDVQMGGAVDATITVNIPDSETRAGGTNSAGSIFDNVVLGTEDDNNTMRYILMIYDAEGQASKDRQVTYSDGKSVNFDVRLVPGRHYSFVVWADYVTSKDDTDFHYYTKDGLTNITLNGTWDAMDETRDAFTGVFNTAEDGNKTPYNGAKDINITLTRPFAKLRVITTDIKELDDLHIAPYKAVATYTTKHYESFNALNSTYAGEVANVEHTYDIASYDDNVTTGDKQTKVLFTDYFFANNEVVNFTLDVKEQNGTSIKFNTFNTAIPAQRNHLTTISGNILTDGNNVKVTIENDGAFAGEIKENVVEANSQATAQAALDNATANTTIYLVQGVNYGVLYLRPAGAPTKEVDWIGNNYRYETYSLFENLTIIGAEGATVDAIEIEGNTYYNTAHSQSDKYPVMLSLIELKNVVIDGVTFTGKGGYDPQGYGNAINLSGSNIKVDGLTLKNCVLNNNDNNARLIYKTEGTTTVHTYSYNGETYTFSPSMKDITVTGCTFNGGYIGLELRETENVTITNNEFRVGDRNILLPVNTGCTYSGNVTITGNVSYDAKERFVRADGMGDAVVVIKDNTLINYQGKDDDYIKVTNANNVTNENNVKASTVTDDASIATAIESGATNILLAEGTYVIPVEAQGKTLKFIGTGDPTKTVIATNTSGSYEGCNYNLSGSTVVFENISITTDNLTYTGYARCNATFNNCIINNSLTLYGDMVFNNCELNVSGDQYNIWTWAAPTATFNGCTFNSDGKSILVYNEGAPAATVTFNECSFNSNGKSFEGKAAVEIDSSLLSDGKHVVRINNCEINGFAAGSVSNSNIYNPKKGDKADIFVDGIQVWAAGYDKLANYPNIFTKDGNYYVFSVAGLQDLNNYFKANSIANILWNHEYNIAADIDATGFAWDGVRVVVGNNGNNGIVLNGNNHTISNLTINGGALLSGTPCGSNEGVNPGLVKDITMKNVVVNGTSHDASVFWGECYTNVNFENVTVDGAKINGGSNVGALVSRTVIDGPNTSIKVNFKDCVVKKSTLEANSTVADPTGASGFIGRAYGNTQLSFENCSVENNTINNAEGLVGGAVYGYGIYANDGWAGLGACDTFTDWSGIVFAATIKGERCTLAEAVAKAEAGDTITLVEDVTLTEELGLPAGIIFNGNGKQINGTIYACGDLTFAGHTKVTAFSASYYDRVITIGEGACLEVTGGGRVSLAYGNTFNITGSVDNAKTADKANIQPSLIIPGGISITGGNDATVNVTNAYISLGNTSSKNNSANGKFTLNFTNSIIECTDQFTLSEPTGGKNPKFNVNITNSVMTTTKKLCIAAANSEVVVNNSILDLKNNFRNSGTFTLNNGSVMTGSTIQFGENGGNNGTINVDASTFTITAGNTASAFDGKGIGSINATNGATVSVDYYKDMTINVDATSTFTGTEAQ